MPDYNSVIWALSLQQSFLLCDYTDALVNVILSTGTTTLFFLSASSIQLNAANQVLLLTNL